MNRDAKDPPDVQARVGREVHARPGPGAASEALELLAPAGDWECARAAVENGADAIYFGLERFNARMRAQNFTAASLPKLMEYLHGRGVKGYVTFNTLVFANELAEAEQYLRTIIAAGVDAAIVQDVGICRLIRQISPDFPIHASTQMTITSAAGVEFAGELGCELIVLARECSIREIEKIREAAERDAGGAALTGARTPHFEVFVHGALCVAYSGQCLTSEALGGRSANRGECAQACRMPYELISDGQLVPLGDRRYLLSPQDLAGLSVLPDLVRAGVRSFKIEGRLKTPEYVANITRAYRHALDAIGPAYSPKEPQALGQRAAWAMEAGVGRRNHTSPARTVQYELEMAFSRGLSTGWLQGIDNQKLVHARFGKKRGVFLGEIRGVRGQTVTLELKAPLKPGDGVVFDSGHPEGKEEGGRVFEVESLGQEAQIRFGRGQIDFSRLHAGDRVWKTSDPELDRELRSTFSSEQPGFRRAIHCEVHGEAGQPLVLLVRDDLGHIADLVSAIPLAKAAKHPLTTDRLREHLGRLGGTPFVLGEVQNDLEEGVILPLKELNRLRREAVERLQAARSRPKRWQLRQAPAARVTDEAEPQRDVPAAGKSMASKAELLVLVRTLPQLEEALRSGLRTLYCEFEDPKRYREAVAMFRQGRPPANHPGPKSEVKSLPSIFVAPPRITKPGEEWILKLVRSSEADGYLIRNYDHLKFFEQERRVGDFSLNIANPLTADYFKSGFDLERVTASYDLNITQLEALLRAAPPAWFEVTIHQHMPMFHMEHCVFCAFLSTGTDYRNCGRPCDHHEVKLRDRSGAEHPLKADAGCRNTVFNALAQTGAEHVPLLLRLGVRHFRIEFLNETPGQVRETIRKYEQLLRSEITGHQLWRELKLMHQLGVTRGPMESRR